MIRAVVKLLVAGAASLAVLTASAASGSPTKMLRYPDIHGERVVFCYAGDLWLAPALGGTATRLTTHPGIEVFPKFSPDGEWIAFTGQYDGDEQVYVMPTTGGVPRQLTYYPARGPLPARWGYDNQVYDWNGEGTAVLFRSMRDGWTLTGTRLFLVDVDGGLPRPLPMPVSGGGDLSPDGRRVVYSPLTRDFRTWKRYQGGWAQDLYVFDLESFELEPVTEHPRSDRDPMWIGDRIYFSSDRDGKLNLYAYDTVSRSTEQLTRSRDWDVRWPSDDGRSRIVYERNGQLEVHDVSTRISTPIPIFVPDDGVARRPSRITVAGRIEDFASSPGGERALFVARGDVFTAPVEHGPVRNLTRSSGAHDKWARWSPDGKSIAYVSDATGEDEIWIVAEDASEAPRRITDGGRVMRYSAEWSPDGKWLAFGDKEGKLWVVGTDGKSLREIADEQRGQIRHYAWSPCSGHLAFTMSEPNGFGAIHVWTRESGELRRVTDGTFDTRQPVWGPEGEYLYYLSDRSYAPQISTREFNFATERMTGIYALALRRDVVHRFPPRSDEVGAGKGADKDKDKDKDADKGADKDAEKKPGDKKDREFKKPIEIDFEGLAARVSRVPVEPDNLTDLAVVRGFLLYRRTPPFYYGREGDFKPELRLFDIEKREDKVLAEAADDFAVAHDGSKVLVRHGESYKRYDVGPEGKDKAKAVSTEALAVDRVPAEEWTQIFDEVWRRYRDFFYVDNMHGYDWEALREQYRPWLAYVGHRSDLNYLIGEMIAELNVGHAYIAGGDWQVPDRPRVALPGARFALDERSNRYRIERIFRGQNEEERYRSPLTEVGVEVSEGDFVLAIDGEELTGDDNPYRLLRHKADHPVELTVNGRPEREGARRVTYNPIDSESNLLYLAMVLDKRERTERSSQGRVGYLHLPNMSDDGIREFVKWFYPQVRKEGLVIDVRSNGGGNVSQMIIERLRRELLGTRFSRNAETPATYPSVVFHGHMACILNEDSASDGDIFPHMFRQAGLGPLIGERSWGGVVGITDRGPLIDGGTVFVPEFGTNALDGSWIIEGHGVDPDIEVANDPKAVLAGADPQLERAVHEILEALEREPKRLPERPAPPVKLD